MKKKSLIFYCITLMAFCQCLPVSALSETQKSAVVDNCETIRDNLKLTQKQDARARVYLGGYYETILSKYIIPLNVRLVENSLADVDLTANQNDFTATKKVFADDYVNYQQGLEELALIDCKAEPERFYEKLVSVRNKRKIVNHDVLKLRELMLEHVGLVKGLEAKI